MSSSTMMVVGSGTLEQAKSVEYYDPDLNVWSKLMDLNVDRTYFRSIMLGEKLMLIGGEHISPSTIVESYDFLTGEFTTVAPLNHRRRHQGVVVLDGLLYVMGGQDGHWTHDTVERYNPSTNQWTLLAPLPSHRYGMGVVILNSEIYAIGGFNATFMAVVEIYNPTTGAWRKSTPMNDNRYWPAAATIGNFIYVAGGLDGSENKSTAERYDPTIDKWNDIDIMSVHRSRCEGLNYNNAMVVAGGDSATTVVTSLVESYDVESDKWSTVAPLLTPRRFFSLVEIPMQYIQAMKNRQQKS